MTGPALDVIKEIGMSKISDRLKELAAPVAESMGFDIYDTEYVKEGSEYYLRIYISKDGSVTSDDCADFSRAMDPILDEEDLIQNSYNFEVCSPGLERRLRLPEHYQGAVGEKIRVKCFKAVGDSKQHVGILKGYADCLILDEDGKEVKIDKENISMCRTVFEI